MVDSRTNGSSNSEEVTGAVAGTLPEKTSPAFSSSGSFDFDDDDNDGDYDVLTNKQHNLTVSPFMLDQKQQQPQQQNQQQQKDGADGHSPFSTLQYQQNYHNSSTNALLKRHQYMRRQQSSTISEVSLHVTSGSLASALVVMFSIYFPFFLAPFAASETYHPAFYHYIEGLSHFDNTAWTYGTDYFLAVCMVLLAFGRIHASRDVSKHVAILSRALLMCYGISVTAGGVAHQFYLTLEDRNSYEFRLLWSLCVGTVCLASTFMGCIGTELCRVDQETADYYKYKSLLFVIPEWFWIAYGCATTMICICGYFSFQRPACDIFIAGITQFPSTFYMMAVLAVGLPTLAPSILTTRARIWGVLGFILNAPLLPMYPLLVQYTNLSLGAVNTLLHMWLLTAWGFQGWVLDKVENSLVQSTLPPPAAIPVPMKIVVKPTTVATGSSKPAVEATKME